MRVLAGDIGGTKTILAIADVEGGRVCLVREKRFVSAEFSSLSALARDFLSGIDARAPRACFGVAGPVVEGRSRVTKLPWLLDEGELARDLGLEWVRLVNDFVAVAHGIEALRPEDLETVNPGKPVPGGTIALLGAGTGLGEAIVVYGAGKRVVVPTEGGHTDFAARDELEIDFLRWMIARHGRVSYDLVLCGRGLADIYAFLRDTGRSVESDALREALEKADDPAPLIHRFADESRDPLCEAALEMFVSIYGAEAGNLGLKALATGGIYLAGGIAPRMIDRLVRGSFRRSFVSKGKVSPIVEAMPVYVVMNPEVGLLGAAVAAAQS